MNNNRRKFLQYTSLAATGYLLTNPLKSIAGISNSRLNGQPGLNTVGIIHTNNLHGKLYAFAFGAMDNVGGLNNIQPIIKGSNFTPLLVDAGGFIGGNGTTADVNMVRRMSKLNYAAATIGDEELANGEAYLATLAEHMDFALVNCNYSLSSAALKAKVSPYHIMRYGQYKIGITGVGNAKNITASHPYKQANEVAGYLKNSLCCNLVICLSALGFKHKGGQPDNKAFAEASENIDVIIGGHGKEIAPPQLVVRNSEKKQVVISNGGYGGSMLGAINFAFDESHSLKNFTCKNYVPGAGPSSRFYDNYKQLTA